MNNLPHTIVIVDDHLLIAKAITSIIDQFPRFKVLYECENGRVMQEKFQQTRNIPEIVLLDISMPVLNGFETSGWLNEHYPHVLIMALTMQGDEESLFKMIKLGCKGYLHKNVHPTELHLALDQIIQKGYYYPDWATSKILHNLAKGGTPATLISLSDREKEFLKYACTEMTYKEIGEKMFCSARTVESYRDALFEKLGVKTRVALALYAVKIGIHKI